MLWGLQFAFLNPALALLLVALFHATAGQVGWVLAVYNVSGTRAIVSFAWVVGPPLASFLIAGFGNWSVLVAIAVVAVLNTATAGAMLAGRNAAARPEEHAGSGGTWSMPRSRVAVIVLAVVALQSV